MRKWYQVFGYFLVLSFAGWLLFYDTAAKPGNLSVFHKKITDCTVCHEPWKGVSAEQCLRCHTFKTGKIVRQEIRFHEAQKNCLVCHREHHMLGATISDMDHRILNDRLRCTVCHFDQHAGLFGKDCRECHGLKTWKVAGYKHPSGKRRDCHLCHTGPQSHYEPRFWELILEDMVEKDISQDECWRCHGINHWEHLKMEHQISQGGRCSETQALVVTVDPGISPSYRMVCNLAERHRVCPHTINNLSGLATHFKY